MGEAEQSVPVGDYDKVRSNKDGIFWDRTGDRFSETRKVVNVPIVALAELDVDGETYYKVRVNGSQEITTQANELLAQLRAEGRIVANGKAQDAVSAILSLRKERKDVHATYGVYSEKNGQLKVCDEPVPVRDVQYKTWESMKDLLPHNPTKADVQAYFDFISNWHRYEAYPVFGMAAIAPFAFTLRRNQVLVGHILHFSPDSDLGKSLLAVAMSERMYGIESVSGGAINSAFRLAIHLDAVCGLLAVEESEKIRPDLWPALKQAAERGLADRRGQQNQSTQNYNSRVGLVLTANANTITSKPTLKRFFIPRFDSKARAERRKNSAKVEALFNSLQPVGFGLTRFTTKLYPTEQALVNAIDKITAELRDAKQDWKSSKRPQMWSVIYLGLKMWESLATYLGIQWKAPSIPDFISEVVEPVEQSTFDTDRTPLSRFRSWFRGYLADARNTQTGIYERETLVTEKGPSVKSVDGYWVGHTILDRYNEAVDDQFKFGSLRELAAQLADSGGIPHDLVFDSSGVVRNKRGVGRAAFVVMETMVEGKPTEDDDDE